MQRYEVPMIAEALVDLHSSRARRPAWADVVAAVRAVAARHAALAGERRALDAGPRPAPSPAAVRGVKAKHQRSAWDHIRHVRGGPGGCWCAGHDHSDTTPYAMTTSVQYSDGPTGRKSVSHHEPVPAWWFSCPRCGDPETAQHFASTWTPAGMAFMRAWRDGVAAQAAGGQDYEDAVTTEVEL